MEKIKMKAEKIREGIYWVGAIDWSIRSFHGYATERGTTYGAYLIIDEKVVLIDTVKSQFTQEMIERIQDVIPLDRIDMIVSNHVEMDHSGAIPALKLLCPNAQIYTSGTSGIKGMTAHYGEYSYIPIKSGENISIGKRTLSFVPTPMLHWPDNMLTYCPEEKILFSNDAFGQHLASGERFDDEMDITVVIEEAKRYYANILMCYGKQVQTALNIVAGLDVDMIAPSHGIIWRSHVESILKSYTQWSENEPQTGAVVIYDSMWNSTEKMARTIAETFRNNKVPVHLYDLKKNHYSNIIPELLTCKYIAVGSPTLNSQMLPTVAGMLCYLKGLSPKNREAFAFGSYGWGGQSIALIEKELELCGFHICLEGIRKQYIPGEKELKEIEEAINNLIDNNNEKGEN